MTISPDVTGLRWDFCTVKACLHLFFFTVTCMIFGLVVIGVRCDSLLPLLLSAGLKWGCGPDVNICPPCVRGQAPACAVMLRELSKVQAAVWAHWSPRISFHMSTPVTEITSSELFYRGCMDLLILGVGGTHSWAIGTVKTAQSIYCILSLQLIDLNICGCCSDKRLLKMLWDHVTVIFHN